MAIVGKLQLVSNIKREIPDNSTGEVSPRDVRHNLLDIVDSVHLFTDDNNLTALNFSSPSIRTTRAGELAIGKLHLDGYSTEDNSAYGYSSLGSNYDGKRNTAIGSYAIGCNVYGSENTAVGFSALAGNVWGSGNVAVGNYALYTNKKGDFNIAIGHGAGYYIGEDSNYKFFLGSHPIDGSIVCDDPVDIEPLLYGDLQSLRLGIGLSTFHSHAALQVAGGIAPSGSCEFDLGHPDYAWNDLYLCNSINDQVYVSGGPALTVKGDIVPHESSTYSLGAAHPKNTWNYGFFDNIIVSGIADIETYKYREINSCIYECRTLYLASLGDICDPGGAPCGFLHDQQLEGAGIVVQSSGTDFRRDYEWVYRAPDGSLDCLEADTPFTRSSWNSNISIHIASGSHLKTDRVIGRDNVAIINENHCYGWFINQDNDIIRGGHIGIDEEQKITLNATGGTFKLKFNGSDWSEAIAFNATSSVVQTALEGLSTIDAGEVEVTGNPGGTWTVKFVGDLAISDQPEIEIDDDDLTLGGSSVDKRKFFLIGHSQYDVYGANWTYWGRDRFINLNFYTGYKMIGGTYKIRYKFGTVGGVAYTYHSTADIPYDASIREIEDALQVSFDGGLAIVNGQHIKPTAFHSSYHTNAYQRVLDSADKITDITSPGNYTDKLDPNTTLDWQPGTPNGHDFAAGGLASTISITLGYNATDGVPQVDGKAVHIVFSDWYDYNVGFDSSNLVFDNSGGGSYGYPPRMTGGDTYAQATLIGTSASFWGSDCQTLPPYQGTCDLIGTEFTFIQPIDDDPANDKTFKFFNSDTVATMQGHFDTLFGPNEVLVSCRRDGTTFADVGLWKEGSSADTVNYGGITVEYLTEAMMAHEYTPFCMTGSTNVSRSYYSKEAVGKNGDLNPFNDQEPRVSTVLSQAGAGFIAGQGNGSVETTVNGSADRRDSIGQSNIAYLTEEANIKPNPLSPEGDIANITAVNFISSSGKADVDAKADYLVSYSHLDSGVVVGQRLVSRTRRRVQDTRYQPPADHIVGFGIDYVDEEDKISYTGQRGDRLTISAYDDAVLPLNSMVWMRSSDPGLVGISDIKDYAKAILPETIFNIQSTGEATIRNTTWSANGKTSLQLLSINNAPTEGVELEYSRSTRRADMSLFDLGDKRIILTLDNDNNFVGIHTLTPHEILTVGSGVDQPDGPAVSMHERFTLPEATDEYGKIYIKPKVVTNQTQAAYLLDDGGNEFDLTLNKYDMNDARAVYTDDNGNTFAGKLSNKDRGSILPEQTCNTAYGSKALYDVTTGDKNTVMGCEAGINITTGYDNTLIGDHVGGGLIEGHGNISIGHRLLSNISNDLKNTITIGGEGLGNGLSSPADDYTLMIGHDNNSILLRGKMGPDISDRHLFVPKTKFSVTSEYNNDGFDGDRLTIRHEQNFFGGGRIGSIIEKVDTNSDYPDGGIAFVFTGLDPDSLAVVSTNTLMTLRHTGVPMSNTCSFENSSRPTVEIKGDLNLQGAINFCDGTNLDSVSGIVIHAGDGLRSAIHPTQGNTEFHVDIEELPSAPGISTITGSTSYLAISTEDALGKINLIELADTILDLTPRILSCNAGGQNHVFTNTSTIEDTTCYSNFFGYKAGNRAADSDFANFIGTEAGASDSAGTAVSNCGHANFIGYRAGYETTGADYSVFLGHSAGYRADGSRLSVFIGDSAGQNAESQRSIGIGDNALEEVTGVQNIEITAGVGGSNRIIGDGEIDNKIAIGTCIAGDMADKKVSLGDARINPDAVLEVKAFLPATAYLQEWKNSDNGSVAHLTKDGLLSLGAGSSPVAALEVKAFLSATDYLQEWKNNEDTLVARLTKDGSLSLGDGGDPDAVLEVKAFLPATNYLQEWKNSADEVVARLTKEGDLYLKGTVTEDYTF